MRVNQALFLCNICVVFRPVLAFRDLLFIHASTNATDDHKYSPFPSQILTVPKFWYHLAHSFSRKNVPFDFERAFWEAEGALSKPKGQFFRENEAQEMTPKLLALGKVCSVLGNIRDVLWHLSKRGSELEKRWTFSILDKNGAHKNKAWVIVKPIEKLPKN